MKRILITGITGFVGTNLVEYLQDKDDIQIFGYSRNIDSAKAKFGDIEFLSGLSAIVLDRYLIDTIVHLSGIAHDLSGDYSKEDYENINYKWTTEIYDQFLKSSVDRFVFISSIKALVDHADEEINEYYKPEPLSHYGVSKYLAEAYILNNQKSNKDSYILRPCMIHGPGNKGNLNLLYKFVQAGIPYPLTLFDNQRSYLSIENFCFIIQNLVYGALDPGEYLLADSNSISTLDLVKLIGNVSGRRVRFISMPTSLVKGLARLGSVFHAPFNSSTLVKLVENMKVSNKKLLLNLKKELPVSTIDGLTKTIKSFNE